MVRDRAWRRWKRRLVMLRRLRDARYDTSDWATPRDIGMLSRTGKLCQHWFCCNPRRHMKGREKLTIQERRALQDRESFSKRKRRKGTHPKRISCMWCGFYLKTVEVQNGKAYLPIRNLPVCKPCEKRRKKRVI